MHGGQHAGVVSGAEIDAKGVAAGAAHRLHVPLHPLNVLHRHGGHILQNVRGGGDAVGKGDDAHAVFHDADLVAHSDAANAGNAGKTLLQGLNVGLELVVVGQQHDKLGTAESVQSLVQVSTLAHSIKLLHDTVYLLP